MKTISRYIMTLVALFAMTTGAWATSDISRALLSVPNSWEKDQAVFLTAEELPGFKAVTEEEAANWVPTAEDIENGAFLIYGFDTEGNMLSYATLMGAPAMKVDPGKMPHNNMYGLSHGSMLQVRFYYTSDVTLVGDKTEATFAMPAADATVDYELVRDLATSTKVDLIIGTGSDAVTATADTRLRIAKSNNVYAPVSALSCNFVDQIENNTILPTGFDDAKLTPQFYLQGEDDTWNLVTDINTTTKLPNNLQPGQVYYITLKAADGSYYDGETQPSYTVTLFEGYEVAVPAGEYVTYYRDEPLYADPVSSADAKLYTISSVSTTDGTATLSDAIATAPSSTPLLVYNAGNTDATFLLIPADAEPNLALTVAPEFIGTTEATTIAASDASTNNYALNGKQFVWVKNAVEIGANKAWLAISSGELQARTITLVFDETTKIANTNVTNITNGNWYDLNGRKLDKMPTKKGVYIFNGRKVVIK